MGASCSGHHDVSEVECEKIGSTSYTNTVDVDGVVIGTEELTLTYKAQSFHSDSDRDRRLGGMSTPSSMREPSLQPFPSESTGSHSWEGDIGVPSLGPVGSAGWPGHETLTENMVSLKKDTLRLFEQSQKKKMTEFNSAFLTPMTLQTYLFPRYAPELLAKTCEHRAAMEDKLNGRGTIRLNGSTRIVGWDGQGRTIVAMEPNTLSASFGEMLDHFEYVYWNALDLNKPGAIGVVFIIDVGGGFNWKQFLSMKAVIDTVNFLKNCVHGRMAALYMVDMPSSFQGIYNAVAATAAADTRERIKCISGVDGLVEALQQLDVDVATTDYFRSFMLQRRDRAAAQTWNPVIDVPFFLERFPSLILNADTPSITADFHNEFRDAVLQFRLHKWGLPDSL